VANAVNFRAVAEPVLHAIYDRLYFNHETGGFDPNKEWDNDTLEDIAEMVNVLYGKPVPRSTTYPEPGT
jgi:hypothetical protein